MTIVSVSASSTFEAISCPGDVLTTECAITGVGLTVWRGTTFQCNKNNDEIVLLHRQLRGSIQTCNNGAIVAQALGVVNNSYISQLNVTVTVEFNNTTVECLYDNGTTVTVIRYIQITVLATGKQE